jgi:hypothetical protein
MIKRIYIEMAVLISVMAGPGVLFGQFSMSSTDILTLIGGSYLVEDDTTENITVNVGNAGENQVWDFRNVAIKPEQTRQEYASPQGTPYAVNFPKANFVLKLSSMDGSEATYIYLQVDSDSLRFLGAGMVSPDSSGIFPFAVNNTGPLPMSYGKSWPSRQVVSTQVVYLGLQVNVVQTTITQNTIDAWGTVKLPVGDFNCLRWKKINTEISEYNLGLFTLRDTVKTIDYSWFSKEALIVVEAESQDDDTNPNFTNAQSFSRLSSTGTIVADLRQDHSMPQGFRLWQNYPNPFNPTTTIEFELPYKAHVDLTIFDIDGRHISTLVSQYQEAGHHSVTWQAMDEHGRPLPSGIYFYKIVFDNTAETRAMVLLR